MIKKHPDIRLFHELSYYTLSLSDPEFVHQYIVDAFTAQTADKHTKPIAITFALVGLYLHNEKNFTGKEVQNAHMRLARFKTDWPKFVLPKDRGEITVSDVLQVDLNKRRSMINSWSKSVWEAYRDSHQKVADFVEKLLFP